MWSPVQYSPTVPTIGPTQVAVPKRFYKNLLNYKEPELKAIGFILPNEKNDFQRAVFAITIDQVEQVTGIDFFPSLPDDIEEELESSYALELLGFSELHYQSAEWVTEDDDPKPDPEGVLYWIKSKSNVRHNPTAGTT